MNKYEIYNLTVNDPKSAKELLVSLAMTKAYNDDKDTRDAFVTGANRLEFTSKDHIIRNSLLEIAETLWYSRESRSKNDRTVCKLAIDTVGAIIDNIEDLDCLFRFLQPKHACIDTRTTVINCLIAKAKAANVDELDQISESNFAYKISELATRLVHPDAIVSGTIGAIAQASLTFLTLTNHLDTEILVERLQNQPGLAWFCSSMHDCIMADLSPFHVNYAYAKEIAAQLSELQYEDRFI